MGRPHNRKNLVLPGSTVGMDGNERGSCKRDWPERDVSVRYRQENGQGLVKGSPGQIYVLSCRSWGDYHKVGRTGDVAARLQSLQCGNPEPITIAAVFEVGSASYVETVCHKAMKGRRHPNGGEFFKGDQEMIVALVRAVVENHI